MPNDNTRDLVSKELVSLLGTSRSQQFKMRVDDFTRSVMDRQAETRARVQWAEKPAFVESSAVQLPSKGFIDRGGGNSEEGQQGGAPVASVLLKDVIFIGNGTGYFVNFCTDGRLEPIT